MAKTKKKKPLTPQERAEELGRRLSDAVCGWLTFQQAARRHRAYNEHLTYLPIFEVADGRKWQVYPQFRVKNKKGEWRSTVDFLFFHERYQVFVLLEIKFQKYKGALVKAFSPDVAKMMRVDHAIIKEQMPFGEFSKSTAPICRLMMTIAQGSKLKKLWNNSREAKRLRLQAKCVFDESQNDDMVSQANHADGCLRISPATIGRDFRVLTLYERKNWKA